MSPTWLPVFGLNTLALLFIAKILHGFYRINDRKLVKNVLANNLRITALSFSLMLVPLISWILSQYVFIFKVNYVLPTTIGWGIIFSQITQFVIEHSNKKADTDTVRALKPLNNKYFTHAIFTLLILFPIAYGGVKHLRSETRPGYSDGIFGFADIPVIVESPWDYFRRHFYARSNKYFFVLDKEAMGKSDPDMSKVEYLIMEMWKKTYPDLSCAHNIIYLEDFSRNYNRFLILDREGLKFSEMRLAYDKKYHCKLLGVMENDSASNSLLYLKYCEKTSLPR